MWKWNHIWEGPQEFVSWMLVSVSTTFRLWYQSCLKGLGDNLTGFVPYAWASDLFPAITIIIWSPSSKSPLLLQSSRNQDEAPCFVYSSPPGHILFSWTAWRSLVSGRVPWSSNWCWFMWHGRNEGLHVWSKQCPQRRRGYVSSLSEYQRLFVGFKYPSNVDTQHHRENISLGKGIMVVTAWVPYTFFMHPEELIFSVPVCIMFRQFSLKHFRHIFLLSYAWMSHVLPNFWALCVESALTHVVHGTFWFLFSSTAECLPGKDSQYHRVPLCWLCLQRKWSGVQNWHCYHEADHP